MRARRRKGNDACTEVARFEQRHQARLRFDHDGRGDARQRRHEAHELDRIAEPVIAAYENLAADEGAAVPHPATMVRQSFMVTSSRIARREHLVADGPGGVMVAAPHRRDPLRGDIATLSVWHRVDPAEGS